MNINKANFTDQSEYLRALDQQATQVEFTVDGNGVLDPETKHFFTEADVAFMRQEALNGDGISYQRLREAGVEVRKI